MTGQRAARHLAIGAIAGAASGLPIAVLAVLIVALPLQSIFIALSPDLLEMLTVGQGPELGVPILIGGATLAGLLGAALSLAPSGLRHAMGRFRVWRRRPLNNLFRLRRRPSCRSRDRQTVF